MALHKPLSFFLVLFFSTTAMADFNTEDYPPYETCALCHDLFGNSRQAKFPKLAGQKPVYLEAQIRAFLSGNRANDGGQMKNIVTELRSQDIAVVVDWFSSQDPPPPSDLPDGNIGASIVMRLGCDNCHGQVSMPDTPHLTAQHSAYLSKQMLDFRDGRRVGTPAEQGHQPLFNISEIEIQQIASYLAAQGRQE